MSYIYLSNEKYVSVLEYMSIHEILDLQSMEGKFG